MVVIKILLIAFLLLLFVGFIAKAVMHAKAAKENLDEIKENLRKKKEEK